MGFATNIEGDHVETADSILDNKESTMSARFASLLPSPAGPSGSKRNRRMRSISEGKTNTNAGKKGASKNKKDSKKSPSRKTSPDSKCDSTGITNNNSIPIFLKKTYKMIDTCDTEIACWNESGDMFVVKDPERFSKEIIPQYFDHNKFASFARQLNFYGFRKMQVKPIRNADFDQDAAKHVTFFNEKFKRGRCDLLKDIQRSTRGGAHASNFQDQQREIDSLQKKVESLEQQLSDLSFRFEERIQGLEFSLTRQFDEAFQSLQKQFLQSTQGNLNNQNSQMQPQQQNFRQDSINSQNSQMGASVMSAMRSMSVGSQNGPSDMQQQWQNQQQVNAMNMNLSQQAAMMGMNSKASLQQNNPTLPPHPKQKQLNLNPNELPASMRQPPLRVDSLRGVSQLRNGSISSNASGVVMRNSWEDKFFSMLMLGDNDPKQASANVERFLRQASQGNHPGLSNASLAQLQGQLMQQQQGSNTIKQEDSSQLFDENDHMYNQNATGISQLNKLTAGQMQPPMSLMSQKSHGESTSKKFPYPLSGRKDSRNNTVNESLSSPDVSPSGSNISLSDV